MVCLVLGKTTGVWLLWWSKAKIVMFPLNITSSILSCTLGPRLIFSLFVNNYGLLVIRQCERIVIFSLHMMIETHLTAHSDIYKSARKSHSSHLSSKRESLKPIYFRAQLNPLDPLHLYAYFEHDIVAT